jgi:hypothetical protein
MAIIMVTGQDDEMVATEAMKGGPRTPYQRRT